jgi:hypothetical protein
MTLIAAGAVHLVSQPHIVDIAKAIGPDRMKRWTSAKDAIDGGGLLVPISDWSVVPSVNPWIAIERLVTRLNQSKKHIVGHGESFKILCMIAVLLLTPNFSQIFWICLLTVVSLINKVSAISEFLSPLKMWKNISVSLRDKLNKLLMLLRQLPGSIA